MKKHSYKKVGKAGTPHKRQSYGAPTYAKVGANVKSSRLGTARQYGRKGKRGA